MTKILTYETEGSFIHHFVPDHLSADGNAQSNETFAKTNCQ